MAKHTENFKTDEEKKRFFGIGGLKGTFDEILSKGHNTSDMDCESICAGSSMKSECMAGCKASMSAPEVENPRQASRPRIDPKERCIAECVRDGGRRSQCVRGCGG